MYGDKVSEKRSFLMVAAVIKETDSYDPYVLYPYICDIIDKSYKGKKGGGKTQGNRHVLLGGNFETITDYLEVRFYRKTASVMVQKCLKEACTVANDVIICYSKGHITLRVLNAIKSISIVLRDNNIFAGDYVIEGIAALFDEASLLQREGEIAQIMDIILAKGYVYVMGSDIPLRLKLAIPVEEPKRIRNLL